MKRLKAVLKRMARLNGLGEVNINLSRLPPALLVDYKKYMEEKKKREARKSIFRKRESKDSSMKQRKIFTFCHCL